MVEEKNTGITKIWVSIPTEYLDRFDTIIEGFYPSRSETIRHGMFSVLKELEGYKKQRKRGSNDTGEAS